MTDAAPKKFFLYCDGASRGNPGPAAYGYVLYEGENVVESAGGKLGITTNNVAEYQGLLKGLERALQLGATEVVLRADSELMVKQLKGEYKVKAPHLLPLYQQALSLKAKLKRFQAEHVRREQNKEADAECNLALDLP